MYKAFKFRMYPDNNQKVLMNKTFGISRFIYNYYLNKIKNNNYINAYSNITDYVNNLKYMYPFLQEVDSIIIRKTLFHLDDNLKKCYCNHCGNIDKKYKDIKERTYECNKCGNVIDRDLNASINILSEGLKLYIKGVYE